MTDTWTIRSVLAWMGSDFTKRGLDSPRLDAELLVARALDVKRVDLYLDLDRPLSATELGEIRAFVGRRREHEPVAYILAHRDFFGRRFTVGPAVLIPRPDTETLVDHALAAMDTLYDGRGSVLDVGTGSGAIAVTLACERPEASITAVDVSAEALSVARGNAQTHEVSDRIEFVEGDLFSNLPPNDGYQLVVANPPYIASGDLASLQQDVRKHEPTLALDGGKDGLDLVRRLLDESAPVTAPNATMLIEIGATQARSVQTLVNECREWSFVSVHKDLGGNERVLQVARNKEP